MKSSPSSVSDSALSQVVFIAPILSVDGDPWDIYGVIDLIVHLHNTARVPFSIITLLRVQQVDIILFIFSIGFPSRLLIRFLETTEVLSNLIKNYVEMAIW